MSRRREWRWTRFAAMVLSAHLAGGCGGLRAGYFSRPYTGEAPPPPRSAANPAQRYDMERIRFPGLDMHLHLRNSYAASDTIWFGIELPMVPLRIKRYPRPDPARAPAGVDVELCLKVSASDLAFELARAQLSVDGVAHEPAAVHPPAPVVFTNGGRYTFTLHFDIPRPLPDRDIRLQLDKAIRHPGLEPFPEIRFRKTRWREPYS